MPTPIIPSALKLLSGHTRGMNPAEPKLTANIPPMPSTLSQPAKKAWPKIVKMIGHLGVITLADEVALEALAECYAELLASRKIQNARTGTTYETATANGPVWKSYPEVAHIADLDRRLRGWLAAFGATPSDRAKVSVVPQAADEDDDIFLNVN